MIQQVFKIADVHVKRITSAINHISHLFPMTSDSVINMLENDMVWIELLINRFGKLQDLLGSKLIDIFLFAQGENIDHMTMLDKINKLECIGVIENAALWKEMIEIRNHIAHEYTEQPELMAKYLNQIFDLTPNLLDIFKKIAKRV